MTKPTLTALAVLLSACMPAQRIIGVFKGSLTLRGGCARDPAGKIAYEQPTITTLNIAPQQEDASSWIGDLIFVSSNHSFNERRFKVSGTYGDAATRANGNGQSLAHTTIAWNYPQLYEGAMRLNILYADFEADPLPEEPDTTRVKAAVAIAFSGPEDCGGLAGEDILYVPGSAPVSP